MKILSGNLNFKGAILSLNAFSDNHSNLDKLDIFYNSIDENKDELFLEDKKGNQNALVIAGDWFIAGGTKGYKTNPYNNSATYQLVFFNKLIDKIKTFAKNTKTYFVPGNHELDAGVLEFKNILNNIKALVLMSNLNFKSSPALKSLIDNEKIVKQDILEIEDDKNPNLKHKALFLGISPINMPYYAKDLDGINFINQISKSGKAIEPADYKETFDETIRIIKEFKKQNPKGLVIISSHTGADFSQNLAQKMGDKNINLILNAHEHNNTIEEISGVKIVNLNQNFNKYVNAKFFIDDDGSLKSDVELTEYYPFKRPRKSPVNSYFRKFYNEIFYKDLEKVYKIYPDRNVDSLSLDGVRTGNNYLANFVVDSILSQIQKTNPEVQIFSMNASAIRTPLDTALNYGADNLQMMNVLNGIVYDDAFIYKNKITGKVLLDLILENLLFNETKPERNPIMHYSGLIIDKKSILENYHKGEDVLSLVKFIKTSDNMPVELDKEYTIANVEKYFRKSKVHLIHDILHEKAEPLNLNAKDLFIKYANENKNNLTAKCDTRIID